ncbi:MAG: PIG-L family deacetylase [Thermoanaerobaculum sp.]|nr:PIG-L family deacetylase [Thermoanaerobaculum sp.]
MVRVAEEQELIPYRSAFPPGGQWLVLAPHPDDETIGMGATLAQAARRGVVVRLLVLTGGQAQGDPQVRQREALAAAATLGVAEVSFEPFVDRQLFRSLGPLARALQRVLRQVIPDVVFSPHPCDLHPDHRVCARALHWALRVLLLSAPRQLPAWVGFYEVGIPLWPNLLVEADAAWQAKATALACYSSQLRVRPYLEVAEGLAAFRALTLEGVQRAEAFQLHSARRAALRSWRWWQRQARGPTRPWPQPQGVAERGL